VRLQVQPAGAGLVAAGMVGEMDVEDAVEMAASHVLGVLVHDQRMVEIVGQPDFRAVDRVGDGEGFG
jgi:hypothetical protein